MSRPTAAATTWLLALLFVGCSASTQPAETEMTLLVADHTVECTGEITRQCLLVRQSPDEPWERFYDPIEGFDYEEGFEYRIRVLRREVPDPPADGSSFEYELIEILSKEATGGS